MHLRQPNNRPRQNMASPPASLAHTHQQGSQDDPIDLTRPRPPSNHSPVYQPAAPQHRQAELPLSLNEILALHEEQLDHSIKSNSIIANYIANTQIQIELNNINDTMKQLPQNMLAEARQELEPQYNRLKMLFDLIGEVTQTQIQAAENEILYAKIYDIDQKQFDLWQQHGNDIFTQPVYTTLTTLWSDISAELGRRS
jgi:hypothetical protein